MSNSLTYPVPTISSTEDLSTEQIHQLLKSLPALARRIRTLADQRFISDALLTQQLKSVNGAVFYETGEPIETDDALEVVTPGANYPRTQAYEGDYAVAKADKWGRDIPITDESISYRGMAVVDKALRQLVNAAVRQVDSAALAVIASKVTQTSTSDPWTTAKGIVSGVEIAKAEVDELGEGYILDTIVLRPIQYATVMSVFVDSGLLPREANNALISGMWPNVLGLTWLRSAHTPTAAPLLLDTNELGGMGEANIGGPGYARPAGARMGLETKVIRQDDNDSYDLRVRRPTVPVVTDPQAGLIIEGTGL